MTMLRFLKPTLIRGQRYEVGQTFETDDVTVLNILLASSKAEFASPADAAKMREVSVASWSKGTASEAGRHDPRWITR